VNLTMTKTVYYAAIGPELGVFDIDVDEAALTRCGAVTLPANIQYAWPHPSRRYLYVASSNGGPRVAGDKHFATALAVDPATGSLRPHGDSAALPSRPIHLSVDRSGEYLLTAYNNPSHITVHRLNADGSIGAPVTQPEKLDTGIYAHQVLTAPSNPAQSRHSRSRTACCATSPRLRPAPGWVSVRGISIFIRPSHGCLSRSSGRTSSMSTRLIQSAGSSASRCSSRIRCRKCRRCGKPPAQFTFIRAANSSTSPTGHRTVRASMASRPSSAARTTSRCSRSIRRPESRRSSRTPTGTPSSCGPSVSTQAAACWSRPALHQPLFATGIALLKFRPRCLSSASATTASSPSSVNTTSTPALNGSSGPA